MKKAFTLAEVLITLTIIGVIAALTIPNLMKKYQKHVWTVQLKNWYSDFSNIVNNYKTYPDFTPDTIGSTERNNWTTGYKNNPFINYLDETLGMNGYTYNDIYSKRRQIVVDFWGDKNGEIKYKRINGDYTANCSGYNFHADTCYWFENQRHYRFKNGAVISIMTNMGDSGGDIRKCWLVTVDVNGPKTGPNQKGRDTFYFYISPSNPRLFPRPFTSPNYCGSWVSGQPDYSTTCNPSAGSGGENGGGISCAERIIKNNWKMDY